MTDLADAPSGRARRTVHVVAHTHWDREWYEPFQRFRFQLVDLLDEVLPRLAGDERFRFTLDGQTAAVDDYLDVRPQERERVVELVRAGRLAVGPWRVLADSFLCSGENLVRNLEIGLARAAELGGAMRVGYLPDQFGHAAQLPQILCGFGFDQACLWRGVPASVDRHTFSWVSPDGSRVRTEYLPGGYGNASVLFTDPAATTQRVADFEQRMRTWFGDVEPLAMYGTDHSAPLPTLVEQVAAVDAGDGPITLRLATLADALAERAAQVDGERLPEVFGELRSHARANLLPGILSVRAPVKLAMARAERVVQRYAEPLTALWAPEAAGPFLHMAWLRLVDSSCHDSVTGCGADSTAEQVAARIAEAEQLGSAVRDRVLRELSCRAGSDAVLVVNPSAERRTDLVRCEVVAPENWPSVGLLLPDGTTAVTQEVLRPQRVLLDATLPADELVTAVRRRTFGQVMYSRAVARVRIAEHTVTFDVGMVGAADYDVEKTAEALSAAVGEDPTPWRLLVLDEPRRELLAMLPVPALGWTTARPVEVSTVDSLVRAVPDGVTNGFVTATARADGTLRLVGGDGTVLDGVGRIVDGGDAGDSYNYGPPGVDTVVDAPLSVTVEPGASGPLVAGFTVRRRYAWPAGLTDVDGSARCTSTVDTEVVTAVQVRAGEAFVRLTVTVDNRCVDHRVRLHVPTAFPATCSHAGGQFAVVRRGLVNEGGNGEEPLPTFPASGFVDAGGAALLLEQATEYEVLPGELAVTLLRATGAISRNLHPLRAEPAGPTTPIPDAQVTGVLTTSLAVLPHAGGWAQDGVAHAADVYQHPLIAVSGTGPDDTEPVAREGLSVSGDHVRLTGLRRVDGDLELRLLACTDAPTTATVHRDGTTGARLTELDGRPVRDLTVHDATVTTDLRPWQLATLRLTS